MADAPQLPKEKQSQAFDDFWDAFRTCVFSISFHREQATSISRREQAADVVAGLLAAAAALGIAAGIKQAPVSVWAAAAFLFGFAGQLRSIFRLPDKAFEHRRIESEYTYIRSVLSSILARAKDGGEVTPELYVQLQLILERFRAVNESDRTDYSRSDGLRLQRAVNAMYRPDTLWMP